MEKNDTDVTVHNTGIGHNKTKHRYSKAFREKVVRMHVDDHVTLGFLSKELKVARSALSEWVKRYRENGADGLNDRPYRKGSIASKLPIAVTEKIIEIKKENPSFGVRRIGDILGRWFGLPGSREKVRTVFKAEGLTTPTRVTRRKSDTPPRGFEDRTKPNDLWQSDIMSFRLAGRHVYLIGFIDDYSRFIVGLGVFTSQTTENVIETYRKALLEHGVPKDLLTDNGRQYTSWRGRTKFESELSKDKVKHVKSRPHHPQTQGKIERFWKTILEEFITRTEFDTFENARERIAMWVKHYNHNRPHQKIEGMCPADRYFEVASEVRKVVERQIEENVLELALRGKARPPFYLVGRMNGQSVVLQAEKGKLKLSTGADGKNEMKEEEFDLGESDGSAKQAEGAQGTEAIQCAAEGAGCACGMDGASQTLGNLSGARDRLDYIKPVAEACDGRHVTGVRTSCEARSQSITQSALAVALAGQVAGDCGIEVSQTARPGCETGNGKRKELRDDSGIREVQEAHGDHLTGGVGSHECDSGSGGIRDLASSLLRVVGSSDACACGLSRRQTHGTSCEPSGSGEEGTGSGACKDQGGLESHTHRTGHQGNVGDASQRESDLDIYWAAC